MPAAPGAAFSRGSAATARSAWTSAKRCPVASRTASRPHTRAQPANRHVAVGRIDLDAVAAAAGFLRGDQGRARTDKGVQYNALSMRTVPDGIRNHGHGLDRRMQAQIIPVAAKAVNASIAPDVRAISAVLAEFHIVDVGRGARLENEHKFMLRPVQ